jgi:hypothetical protein
MAEKITNLRLNGFSIEVTEDPVTLLMQTDKGPFSIEIPKAQLSKLVYALRFVLYAEEPLRKKREIKQSGARGLYASAKKPSKKLKGK